MFALAYVGRESWAYPYNRFSLSYPHTIGKPAISPPLRDDSAHTNKFRSPAPPWSIQTHNCYDL
jgi:hypothetical protein